MLKITIPITKLPERRYIIGVLVGEFLGLEFSIDASEEVDSYRLELENGSILEIADAFFGNLKDEEGYLLQRHLPAKPLIYNGRFSESENVVCIYGKPEIFQENEAIKCGIDLFAGAFFLLSRWEEVVLDKDDHGRAIESETYLMKHQLQHNPVVDHYTDFLWNMLLALGLEGGRKPRTYEVVVTHDVDHIARYDTINKLIRALVGDVVLRKRPFRVFTTLKEYAQVNFFGKKDNYDTQDWLMDVSEAHGLKSRFYFIPGKPGELDYRYDIQDKRVVDRVKRIQARKHIVGMHGSYSSYNNPSQFAAELQRLNGIGAHVTEGRQHYLRFENSVTWQNWNDNHLQFDSSVGYNSDIGFKAGTSHPYPVFDVLKREQLDLMERPLIIMEVPLIRTYKSTEQAMIAAKTVIDECKKHSGKMVFLWHPENFNHPFWGAYRELYEKIIDYAVSTD